MMHLIYLLESRCVAKGATVFTEPNCLIYKLWSGTSNREGNIKITLIYKILLNISPGYN